MRMMRARLWCARVQLQPAAPTGRAVPRYPRLPPWASTRHFAQDHRLSSRGINHPGLPRRQPPIAHTPWPRKVRPGLRRKSRWNVRPAPSPTPAVVATRSPMSAIRKLRTAPARNRAKATVSNAAMKSNRAARCRIDNAALRHFLGSITSWRWSHSSRRQPS